jgi:fluoride exporter
VIVLGVALAGAIGAPARYVVEMLVRNASRPGFPWGTLVVNLTGSFVLGVVVGLATTGAIDGDARTVAGTGFLGAYTTFSTYAYETVRLAEGGDRSRAVAYALGSVLAGSVAAALGLAVTGAL